MLDFLQISEEQIVIFFLVFLRLSAFCASWPVFAVSYVPNTSKVLLALSLSLLIFPTLSVDISSPNFLNFHLFFLVVHEVFIGLIFGFLGRLFFYAISSAGQIMSLSMGLSSATIFNPSIGSQGNVVEQVQMALTTLLFLLINGHHHLLMGLTESFSLFPISSTSINFLGFKELAGLGQEILLLAIKISAPVMLSVTLVNIAMGIIGRAVPQINVLVTSIPVNIFIGLICMILSLPLFIEEFEEMWQTSIGSFFSVIKTF